jgi:glutathionylspermidine synthase
MVIFESEKVSSATVPLHAAAPLDSSRFENVRRTLVLDHCKWDPQVGDTGTISRFPLMISAATWRELSSLASQLAAELMTAEAELMRRPELHGNLGLPRRTRAVLRRAEQIGVTPSAARVLRFDFHWTDLGWKISEVNSDVPGGFCEASELPALMSPKYPGTRPAGHPGAAWADALSASAISTRSIALLSAPGYMEDRQVLAYLARLLGERGLALHWTQLADLHWTNGVAYFNRGPDQVPLGAIVRFYQAEWLNTRKLPELFLGGRTPVSNPGIAILTESKRFPLLWDRLSARLPTWRRLLPETRDPRQAPWKTDEHWLVKSAFCNTGDTVAIRTLKTDRQWNAFKRAIWLNPRGWVAQRRFNTLPISTVASPIYPCIGVYTINGRSAGIYGRYSVGPVIDYRSVDVAVLVEDDSRSVP